MAHGGYGKKKAGKAQLAGRREGGGASGVLRKGADKQKNKKTKVVSIKNQIRGIERLLKKVLPAEVKDAQQKKLEELKQQSDVHFRIELERKMALRYRKVKFFERRKIERRIRRLEKQQRTSDDNPQRLADIAEQLTQLKEDLEYVRFFPKTEKYISLFMGSEDEQVVTKRNVLRDRIKANLLAAAATGVDLEGSEDEAVDMSEDDFFMAGSSSDDVDADDEWTDKSPRFGEERDDTSKELLSSTPKFIHNKASKSLNAAVEKRSLKSPKHAPPKGKDQLQSSVKVLMLPPTTRGRGSTSNATVGNKLRSSSSSHMQMGKRTRYSQLSSSTSEEHVRAQTRGSSSSTIFENVKTTTLDIQRSKPKRKRRPKKKKTT
ncbi:hypothetical protein CY35_03G119100 [Sphagnum magellanicum]|nr:hypothetical protein CY35_03G119100 [Sphagnum magellanicum]